MKSSVDGQRKEAWASYRPAQAGRALPMLLPVAIEEVRHAIPEESVRRCSPSLPTAHSLAKRHPPPRRKLGASSSQTRVTASSVFARRTNRTRPSVSDPRVTGVRLCRVILHPSPTYAPLTKRASGSDRMLASAMCRGMPRNSLINSAIPSLYRNRLELGLRLLCYDYCCKDG